MVTVAIRPNLASACVAYQEDAPREQATLPGTPFQTWRLPDDTVWAVFLRSADGYLVRFPTLADFEVSPDGKRVRARPAPGASNATLHQLYLNQVLPLALSQQGQLVLHASAVDIGGQAVAFTGPSGRGKSTLACSFATHRSGFLTDDGLHLLWRDGELTVVPSHPSVRLWSDSRTALGTNSLDLAAPLEYGGKARFLAGEGLSFCGEERPLRRIYLLGPGTAVEPEIRRMKPQEALMAMVGNSFLLDIHAQENLARHFSDFARIADMPIHYYLDYRRHYDDLSRLRDLISRHLLETATE